MSITNELREYATTRISPNKGMLEAIADRIDAEHEDAVRKKAARMLTKTSEYMNDDDLAEIGLVRLPVDADGEPIRFGDKITVSWSEKVYEVRGFSYTEQLAGGKRTIWVDAYSLEKMRNIPLCGASSCHHYKPPTVEDVLREMHAELDEVTALYVGEAIDSDERDRDEARIFAEYAAKLRLADDEEDE